jgi:hypothetical protein
MLAKPHLRSHERIRLRRGTEPEREPEREPEITSHTERQTNAQKNKCTSVAGPGAAARPTAAAGAAKLLGLARPIPQLTDF